MRLRALRRGPHAPQVSAAGTGRGGRDRGGTRPTGRAAWGSLQCSAPPAGPEARPRGEGGGSLPRASPSSAAAWAGNEVPCPAGQPEPSGPSLQSRPWRQAGRGAEGGQSPGGSRRLRLRLCPRAAGGLRGAASYSFLTGPFQAEILCC